MATPPPNKISGKVQAQPIRQIGPAWVPCEGSGSKPTVAYGDHVGLCPTCEICVRLRGGRVRKRLIDHDRYERWESADTMKLTTVKVTPSRLVPVTLVSTHPRITEHQALRLRSVLAEPILVPLMLAKNLVAVEEGSYNWKLVRGGTVDALAAVEGDAVTILSSAGLSTGKLSLRAGDALEVQFKTDRELTIRTPEGNLMVAIGVADDAFKEQIWPMADPKFVEKEFARIRRQILKERTKW